MEFAALEVPAVGDADGEELGIVFEVEGALPGSLWEEAADRSPGIADNPATWVRSATGP